MLPDGPSQLALTKAKICIILYERSPGAVVAVHTVTRRWVHEKLPTISVFRPHFFLLFCVCAPPKLL